MNENLKYKCLQCLKSYKSACGLGKILYFKVCPMYSLAFTSHSQLKAHKKKHAEYKEWLCPYNNCQCAFISKVNVEQHRQICNTQEIQCQHLIKYYLQTVTWMTIFIRSMSATSAPPVSKLVTTIMKCLVTSNFPAT